MYNKNAISCRFIFQRRTFEHVICMTCTYIEETLNIRYNVKQACEQILLLPKSKSYVK